MVEQQRVVSRLWRVVARLVPGYQGALAAQAREFLVGAESSDEARKVVRDRLCSPTPDLRASRSLPRSLPPSPWRAAVYEVEPVLGSVLEVR